MKLTRVLLLACAAATLSGCGVRKAMYDQPKYEVYQKTDFFGDNRVGRVPVEGTIARGHLNDDTHLYLGQVDGKPAETFPFPITKADLLRGQERFNIYCAPCHDRTGQGWGMVVQRGFKRPPSYHIDRLRQAPPGYFFDVMTKGFGQMPNYVAQVNVQDRWRIAAYIRVLQLSQNARIGDVPEADRSALASTPAATESHGTSGNK